MYYRARQYSPATGRFLQRDPLGYGAGPNVFEYVGSLPTCRRDPFGLRPEEDDPLSDDHWLIHRRRCQVEPGLREPEETLVPTEAPEPTPDPCRHRGRGSSTEDSLDGRYPTNFATVEACKEAVEKNAQEVQNVIRQAENSAISAAARDCEKKNRRRGPCVAKGDFVDADRKTPGTQAVSSIKCALGVGAGADGSGKGRDVILKVVIEYEGKCVRGSVESAFPDRFPRGGR